MDDSPTREGTQPPRNLQLLAFPIAAAGLLAYITHVNAIGWLFGLSLMAWCVVMIVWLLKYDYDA
jgi:uncharacterized membrane protein AbrB (regulator of aidB expression)